MRGRIIGRIEAGGGYTSYLEPKERGGAAEICKTRQFPGLKTDTRFAIGKVQSGHPFSGPGVERWEARAKTAAAAAGVDTTGKYFFPSAAESPTDPNAWIEPSRAAIRKHCEDRGWGCEGAVSVKRTDCHVAESNEPYEVADDIVKSEVEKVVTEAGHTDLTPSEKGQLFRETKARLSGSTESAGGDLKKAKLFK